MTAELTNEMNPQQTLAWYVDMGVDEVIGDEAVDHFTTIPIKNANAETVTAVTPVAPTKKPRVALTLSASEGALLATKIAKTAKTVAELKTAIEGFDGCGLIRTAMNTVFADGNEKADIMIVGEAPNADEDRIGQPFVGEVGALLDKMMAAIGRERSTGFYTTNIVPWRPPGNRKPTDDELVICLPFIKRHIELIAPKVLFLMGHTAISALLNDHSPTKDVRGKWNILTIGELKIDTIASYHPSRLLKQPQAKKASWQDLLDIKAKIGE